MSVVEWASRSHRERRSRRTCGLLATPELSSYLLVYSPQSTSIDRSIHPDPTKFLTRILLNRLHQRPPQHPLLILLQLPAIARQVEDIDRRLTLGIHQRY